MTTSLEVLVDIPVLSLLLSDATAPHVTSEQVAVNVRKLAYSPGAADVWNLPAEQPDITGTLDLEDSVPRMRCALPWPTSGEVALYLVTILKTGLALDEKGKTRAPQLLPTEEELLFFVLGASDGSQVSADMQKQLIPGIQYVVVPTPT